MGLSLGLYACGPSPEDLSRKVLHAALEVELDELQRWTAPTYADGRGGWAELETDLRSWRRLFQRRVWNRLELEDRSAGPSRAVATVEARFALAFDGLDGPDLRASGTMVLQLVRDGQLRVRSGVMPRVRQSLALLDARRRALEANDLDALTKLIHRSYRDGPLDRFRLLEKLRNTFPRTAVRRVPISYRVEIRDDLVHVDAHYRIEERGSAHPQVDRLTLAQSAGALLIRAGLNPPSRGSSGVKNL